MNLTSLLQLHPLEIARQITLIESEMFRNVTVGELSNFGCCSSKDRDQKRRMFPNVVAWQNFNNKVCTKSDIPIAHCFERTDDSCACSHSMG